MGEARYVSQAETAKLMKKQLKAAFPAVKFSVTGKSYSGGGSITVRWTDGPTRKRVQEITGQYGGKGFDGMIDMAYYIDSWVLDGEILGTCSRGTEGSRGSVPAWGKIPPHDDAELVHFAAGYVSEERRVSPALANRCIAQLAAYWGATEIPVAVPGWGGGYEIADGMGRQKITPGSGLEWYEGIHQAAADASRFAPRPMFPDLALYL